METNKKLAILEETNKKLAILDKEIEAINTQIKTLIAQEQQVKNAIEELMIIRDCFINAHDALTPEAQADEQLEFPFVGELQNATEAETEAN
jgi:ABC-type transporter lipoprotein component MlaA